MKELVIAILAITVAGCSDIQDSSFNSSSNKIWYCGNKVYADSELHIKHRTQEYEHKPTLLDKIVTKMMLKDLHLTIESLTVTKH